MDIPVQGGKIAGPLDLCCWLPPIPQLANGEFLQKKGYEPLPLEEKWLQLILLTTFASVVQVGESLFALPDDIAFAHRVPVALAYQPQKEETGPAEKVPLHPPRWIGMYGLLRNVPQSSLRWLSRPVERLGGKQQTIHARMQLLLDELATLMPWDEGWLRLWKQLHLVAQSLAEAYWESRQVTESSVPPAAMPAIFVEGVARGPVCPPLLAVMEALDDAASGWQRWDRKTVPTFLHNTPVDKMQVSLQPPPLAWNEWEQLLWQPPSPEELWKQVSEWDGDLVLLLLLIYQKQRQQQDFDGTIWITPELLLALRGLQPVRWNNQPAGWRPGERLAVIYAFERAAWFHLNGTYRLRQGRSVTVTDDRLLVVEERRWTGETPRRLLAWRCSMGSWVKRVLKDEQFLGLYAETAFQFDLRWVWERRIARYCFFAFQEAIEGGEQVIRRQVGELLRERALLPVHPKRPKVTYDRFEQALRNLKAARLIGEWRYQPEVSRGRTWLDGWLQAEIEISLGSFGHSRDKGKSGHTSAIMVHRSQYKRPQRRLRRDG